VTSRAELHPWSVGATVFIVTVCMTPLTLAHPIVSAVGQGVLLWMLVSGLMSLLGIYINASLVDRTLTGWAARVQTLLRYPQAAFYFFGAAAFLSAWLSILSATELPATPRIVLSLLTVGVSTYALRLGIETTVRLNGLLALILFFALYALLFGLLPAAHFARLLPHPLGTGVIPWIWPVILFIPRGYIVLPTLAPLVRGPYRTAAYVGDATGSVFLALSLTLPALVLGFPPATQFGYPFLRAVSVITSRYFPFERMAFLSFIAWQMIIFTIVTMYSVSCMASLRARLHPVASWTLLLPLMLAVLVASLYQMPSDVLLVLMTAWSSLGIFLFFVMPALLLILGPRRVTA
jgi:hypothetical protein